MLSRNLLKKHKAKDFTPRVGDYCTWPDYATSNLNRMSLNKVIEVTPNNWIITMGDGKYSMSSTSSNLEYLLWYRPSKKVIIIEA